MRPAPHSFGTTEKDDNLLPYIAIITHFKKVEVMIMAEEKPTLKQLFVYKHDARRMELFI